MSYLYVVVVVFRLAMIFYLFDRLFVIFV